MADLSDENKNLRTKVAELAEEKVILEKVATAPVFATEHIDNLVEELGKSKLIDPLQTTKVAALIKEDPQQLLSLMEKLAESAASYPSGEGIPSEAQEATEDPDGWGTLTRRQR